MRWPWGHPRGNRKGSQPPEEISEPKQNPSLEWEWWKLSKGQVTKNREQDHDRL